MSAPLSSQRCKPLWQPGIATFASIARQRIILEISHMTMAITLRTRSTPTQTPALKMTATNSQPVSATAEISINTDHNHDCFMDTPQHLDRLTGSLPSETDRTSNFQNLLASVSGLVNTIHFKASRIPVTLKQLESSKVGFSSAYLVRNCCGDPS